MSEKENMFNLMITLSQIFINSINEKVMIKVFPILSFGKTNVSKFSNLNTYVYTPPEFLILDDNAIIKAELS